MRGKLKIATDLSLSSEAVARTFGILAQRGAGKSNAAVVMAEEMYRVGLHWVAIDPKGDWWGVRSSADGKGPGLPIPIFGGAKGDVPLEATGGAVLADLVVDEALTCVLDVSEFTEAEKIRFLAGHGREEGFAGRLFRRKNGEQAPTHLFLEEAHDYIPQKPFRDQAKLVHVFGKLVTMGRTKGLGATLISQRSARLHKDVLTQVDTLIVLRTTGPQDRKAIAAWLEYHGQQKEILESLPKLKDGEAWVWSPEWLGKTKRVRFRKRSTFDSGATPKTTSRKRRRPATLADVDLKAIEKQMKATIERAKQEDPKQLRAQVSKLKRELAAAEKAKPEPEVQRVEVPIISDKQIKRFEGVAREFAGAVEILGDVGTEMKVQMTALISALRNGGRGTTAPRPSAHSMQPMTSKSPAPVVESPDGFLPTGPQQRILDALAWLEAVGIAPANRIAVAFIAGYRPNGGAFNNPLGNLRTNGCIEYPQGGAVSLTELGTRFAVAPGTPLGTKDLHQMVLDRLPGPERRILEPLLDGYPNDMSMEELAAAAGYQPTGGAFNNPRGRLRSLGLIGYPSPGRAAALPVLFLE